MQYHQQIIGTKKRNQKKVDIANDVTFQILHPDLLPTTEAGMMCMIGEETFFLFINNTWNSNLGISCYIVNDNLG